MEAVGDKTGSQNTYAEGLVGSQLGHLYEIAILKGIYYDLLSHLTHFRDQQLEPRPFEFNGRKESLDHSRANYNSAVRCIGSTLAWFLQKS